MPTAVARIYDVPYGMIAARQPASFGLDGYGRILYPTAISQTVTLIDNAGNEILRFGTYGNPDSKGGLPGEQVPTIDIPLANGHTVDISDDTMDATKQIYNPEFFEKLDQLLEPMGCIIAYDGEGSLRGYKDIFQTVGKIGKWVESYQQVTYVMQLVRHKDYGEVCLSAQEH